MAMDKRTTEFADDLFHGTYFNWVKRKRRTGQRERNQIPCDTAGIIFLLKIIEELFFSMNIIPVETLHFVCVLNSRIHSTMMRISWAA